MREVFFNNGAFSPKAMGLAIDATTRTAYYVSMAGPQTNLDSVRASLFGRTRRVTARGWHAAQFNLLTPTISVKRALHNTPEQHWLVKSKAPGLVLIDDPEAAGLSSWDRLDRHQQHREQIAAQLTNAINAVTRVPWPAEWTERLLDRPPYGALTKLDCYGDALVAYLVNPNFEWIAHGQEELRGRRLFIPPQPLIAKVDALRQEQA